MDKKHIIYLDHNATTPVAPEVLESMLPYFKEMYGNSASRQHILGWQSDEGMEQARAKICKSLQINEKEIIYTSGATESINLALKGVFHAYRSKGKHIICCTTEHNAVLDTCEFLEKQGADIDYLHVDKEGLIDLNILEETIREDTLMVCIMWANNESGVIQDVKAIGDICHKRDVLFFTDATQAVGKITTHPKLLNIHLMAFSAHKFYGPKGVGGLFINYKNPRVVLTPQIHGGGHQRDIRSGTSNVPGIIGMAKALELSQQNLTKESNRLSHLRDHFESEIEKSIQEIMIHGHREKRLTHVSYISFKYIDAELLISAFNQKICVSTGSACTSAQLDPSHVLSAMGVSDQDAHASIRFSLGRATTLEDINFVIDSLIKHVQRIREQSPVWQMFLEGIL